jgi:radical SAM protein with 4Fe4S-binding SPASM domain
MAYHLNDILVFLKKMSIRRVVNILLVLSSYYISKILCKPIQWGLPFTVSFEPTTACNLRCPECPSGLRTFTRPTGNLKKGFFESTLDQIAHKLTYLIFYFQGEPYINPDFLDMVQFAEKKGIYTITSTNGHFLSNDNARKTIESGLSRIIISIDGVTQESYEKYRKEGKLENVLAGVNNLVKWKKKLKSKTPHIIFQFLVVKHNEHEIDELYNLAKRLEVNEVKLKTAQVYNYKNGNDLIPLNEKYSRYRKRADGTYEVKHTISDHCWKLWHANVITWDGKIVPCCFDKDAKYEMGDLHKEKFADIWKGNTYLKFRKAILKSRKEIEICKNCSEGCKVFH